jgi:predicted ArsR family transcriptional regulator
MSAAAATHRSINSALPGNAEADTRRVGEKLGLPTNTARRILEDLMAYGLIGRRPFGKKQKADSWFALNWDA